MKKKLLQIILLLLPAMIIASCSKEDKIGVPDDEGETTEVYIKFSQPGTRAQTPGLDESTPGSGKYTATFSSGMLVFVDNIGKITKKVTINAGSETGPHTTSVGIDDLTTTTGAHIESVPKTSKTVHVYGNIPTELAKIAKDITQITTTPGAQIQTIQITGYASPEGSHTHNEHLAAARAAAFKTYIAETYNLPIEKIKVTSIAEDWNGLRLLVEQSDLIRKAEVLTIIDSPSTPDHKEQQLRTLGWPWTAISNTMFPLLRRVEYTIHYTVTEDPQQ